MTEAEVVQQWPGLWELQQKGDYEGAARKYEEALKAKPDSPELKAKLEEMKKLAAQQRNQAGEQLAQRGDVQKAIQEFDKSLQIDPSADNRERVTQARRSAAKNFYNLGYGANYDRNFADAQRDLKNALALDPTLKEAKDALKQAEAQQRIEDQVQVAQKAEVAKAPAEAMPTAPAAQPQALDAVTQALDQRLAQRKVGKARPIDEKAAGAAGGRTEGAGNTVLYFDGHVEWLGNLRESASRGVDALEKGRYEEAKKSLEEVLASKVDLGPAANRALREHLAKAQTELEKLKARGKEDHVREPKGVLTTPGVAAAAEKPAGQRTLGSLSLLFDQYISARKAHEAPRREYEVRDKLVALEEFPRKEAALGEDRKRAEKGRHWFRPEAAAEGLAPVSGGKAAGVLPIALQFPATGTVGYYFERPYAGGLRGEIRLECIRIGAALCLQGALAFLIIVALAAGYRRRPLLALEAGGVLVVVLAFLYALATEAAGEYFIVAIWAAALTVVVLGVLRIARRLPAGAG
ncbi:MAG: hypothetical protein FJ279_25410 [Planctomycetes bacterium]|nr:hypothetical protein [Planctomycetota bacterium]